MDNLEFASQMLTLFESTAPDRIGSLRDALNVRDSRAIKTQAHGLKGVAAYLAAHGMHHLCDQIESSTPDADWDRTRDRIQQLEKELQRAMDYIPVLRGMIA
jgi:HPt (histidine-containing phosphotransfer) domain-containing protein